MQPNASSSHLFAPLRQRLRDVSIALLAASCLPTLVSAQPAPLTVDSIVQKLQANLDAYAKSIPNFLVEEHIDSAESSTAVQISRRGPGLSSNHEMVAESIFRLKRKINPANNTFTFEESRDVTTIDGRPANGRGIDAPSMIAGAFSGGLAFVSQSERACMTYTLEATKPGKPIVVRYQSAPHIAHPEECILAEDTEGRVWIDPVSMQIQRIEVDVPRHMLTPVLGDGRMGVPTQTHWTVEVIYKPVVLNNRNFWLPATIISNCSNDDTQWSFRGSYRNYHLLEVNSHIVVPGDASKQ